MAAGAVADEGIQSINDGKNKSFLIMLLYIWVMICCSSKLHYRWSNLWTKLLEAVNAEVRQKLNDALCTEYNSITSPCHCRDQNTKRWFLIPKIFIYWIFFYLFRLSFLHSQISWLHYISGNNNMNNNNQGHQCHHKFFILPNGSHALYKINLCLLKHVVSTPFIYVYFTHAAWLSICWESLFENNRYGEGCTYVCWR